MTSSALVPIAEGLWAVEGRAKLAPGFVFPVRCTVVRADDGGLLLYSPVHFSDDIAADIRALGEVRTIFAPNLFHTKWVAPAVALFPEAKLSGPVGLGKKLKGAAVSHEVSAQDGEPFGPNLPAVFVGGAPTFNEILLEHRPSGTLIVGDYLFNIHEAEGFLTRFILKNVSGAYERPAMSKLWKKAMKDRALMKAAAEKVLGLDVERVVVCHGRVIEGAKPVLQRELAWLVEG